MPPKTEAASLVCRAANWPIVLIPTTGSSSSRRAADISTARSVVA
ncbi:Uncharacterised protein [Mycobacteroides abscessus subsp. abscessus]|nr:Uncharacterised protein [Mycobacteroides abscessus subsp. abscessus]